MKTSTLRITTVATLALVAWTASTAGESVRRDGQATSPPAAARVGQAAGIVTTALGQVTRTAASAAPAPLGFREPVFIDDRIATGERSLARILFGGAALVTITELSALTVTEAPHLSVMDLSRGRAAVAVSRERMRPGDAVEIRTPGAIAAIRGTVVIVEVVGDASGSNAPSSRFTVLKGIVDVRPLHPPAGATMPSPVTLRALESATINPAALPVIHRLSEHEAALLAARFRIPPASGPTERAGGAEAVQPASLPALPEAKAAWPADQADAAAVRPDGDESQDRPGNAGHGGNQPRESPNAADRPTDAPDARPARVGDKKADRLPNVSIPPNARPSRQDKGQGGGKKAR